MSFKAILYAYVLGGFTFIPLALALVAWYAWYTAIPIQELQEKKAKEKASEGEIASQEPSKQIPASSDVNDIPKTRKSWLTVRRTFEEPAFDGGYVNLMRSFLDARSKDPKRSRPKDLWFVVLKGKILYLYEDEGMTECEAVIQLGSHDVVVYPENLLDGELFTRRNAICLKPKSKDETGMPSLSREMKMSDTDADAAANVEKTTPPNAQLSRRKREKEKEMRVELEKDKIVAAREEALEPGTPWFIFVRSPYEMEDWYLSMIHASDNPPQEPLLSPLQPVFLPSDMNILVSKLDEQPDVIPMRWFNALLGRILLSFYRTQHLESFIVGRLMKKISKVKRPAFLPSLAVTEVSVGNRTPLFSKPMLKELTKEGDASMEVHLQYKGEVRITIEATALLTLPGWKNQYTVKIALAAILKEIEGNMLIKIKRPPSNRIWYAFTQMPKIVLEVEPIVSDRQITWGMILSTIESKIKEIIQESVVLPNMDDISYFESAGYEHRGGIWADAARKPRPSPQPDTLEEPTLQTGLQSETPAEENPTPESSETLPALSLTKSPTTFSTSSEPTLMNGAFPEDYNGKNKRKTWFSSVRGMDSVALGDDSDDTGDDRGNVTKFEESLPPRPRSVPKRAELVPGDVFGIDDQQGLSDEGSQTSHKQWSSGHSYSHNEVESTYYGSSTSVNSTSDRIATASPKPNAPSSPSSFLTAFKAKAADKQALSNTAKETMKKWGMNVNWGNLRKDTASSGSGTTDDLADHEFGSGISRARTTSTLGNTTGDESQKPRASYADVRAAVAERRGRQLPPGSGQVNGEDDTRLTPDRAHSRSTTSRSPDPSRDSTNYKDDTTSSSASDALTPSARRLSSASGTQGYMVGREDHPHAPPVSRSLTQDSQYKGLGTGTPPIYSVQPQARTMSIPGIHASHRGEVMSMGYVAPPQHPQPSLSASSSPENKSKVLSSLGGSAGIQSVYRLFSKNQGQQQQAQNDTEGGMETPPSTSGANEQDGDTDDHLANLSSTLTPDATTSTTSAIPPRKKTPPPLPPRSSPALPVASPSNLVTATVTPNTVARSTPPPLPPRTRMPAGRTSSETSTATVSISAGPSMGTPMATPTPPSSGSDEQPSPASEKLKSIAKRASLTGPKEKEREKDDSLSPPSVSVDSVGVTA